MAPSPLRIHVLALQDSTALVPIGLVEMRRKASELASSVPSRRPRPKLETTLTACGADLVVRGAGNVRIHCDASQ